ncbi:uncharacterized protein DUF1636 [Paracoccus pantotrophus]|uniref:DUF1636 domain-containing protein n=1 Tax=Paracoccus pantotrophus TaxID=82367 RepID=A0AAE6TTL9_PARPN|nr:DUF1636 family protein [Paracoccus pantotrophus]QFG36824.1 DUF1636 domain-containing protein [Paracoccus pantotrophus]RKS52770.1 uncharacterized protein DUF1636 [Paracoccus pantotrophus]
MPVTLTLPPGPEADALADALADTLRRLGPDIALRRAALHARDARPVLMALQAPGRGAYLFHGLRPADAGDIAATIRAYLAAADGWITDARPCGQLRLCLKLRIPAG